MKISLLLFAIAALAVSATGADRPNIMLFLVDDMGVMDTSVPFLTDAEGEAKRYPLNDFYRTPGMERLADRGVRFNQFYAMSVCSPTRASIMTGQNAARHHTTNFIRPESNNAGHNGAQQWNWEGLKKGDVTLPGQLRASGYQTIFVGKAHFAPIGYEGADPLNLGFDVNVAGASFGAPGSYLGEKHYGGTTKRTNRAVPHLEAYHGTDTFLTEALTLEAKKQIDSAAKQDAPFFLYFGHYAVHTPFDTDPRFAANYESADVPKSAKAFATLIEGMDKSLGDMLDHFEALGIAEDTLIIFLGDNGTDAPLGNQHKVACAAPLRGKKGAHYEGGMRVPFIAAWAKPDANNAHQKRLPIAAGGIQSQVASVEDIYPTLLNLAGADSPESHVVDGTPLDTLISGKADAERAEQFLMHYPHGIHRSSYFTVWRDGDWKLIFHALPEIKGASSQSGGETYQLFNLAKDPFEQKNLAEKNPKKLKAMLAAMAKELEAHGAQYSITKDGEEIRPQ
ncbi:MAG: sulfatase [Verrucomicrobiota bacterium]